MAEAPRAFLCVLDRESSSKAHQVLPKTFWSKPVASTLWVLVRSRDTKRTLPVFPHTAVALLSLRPLIGFVRAIRKAFEAWAI